MTTMQAGTYPSAGPRGPAAQTKSTLEDMDAVLRLVCKIAVEHGCDHRMEVISHRAPAAFNDECVQAAESAVQRCARPTYGLVPARATTPVT